MSDNNGIIAWKTRPCDTAGHSQEGRAVLSIRTFLLGAILWVGTVPPGRAEPAAWYVVTSEVDDDETFIVEGALGSFRCDAMTYCRGIATGDRVLFLKAPGSYVNDEVTYGQQRCAIWDCDPVAAPEAAEPSSAAAELQRLRAQQKGDAPGECVDVRIKAPSPFRGNTGDVFHLEDGSAWIVGEGERNNLYAFDASAQLCDGTILVVDAESIAVREVE
jgi:hypothetical protein